MAKDGYNIIIGADGVQKTNGLNNLTATTNPLVGSDNTLGYDVGSTWVNTTAGTVWHCVDASTGAAVWVDLSATSVEPIKLLSTTTAIDCTTAAQTTLYTVPAATTTYITQALVVLTTVTGGTGNGKFPIIGVGIGGTFDNIFSLQRLTGLDAITEFWHLNTSGVSTIGSATDVIAIDVDTISNATAYTVTVILMGYNV